MKCTAARHTGRRRRPERRRGCAGDLIARALPVLCTPIRGPHSEDARPRTMRAPVACSHGAAYIRGPGLPAAPLCRGLPRSRGSRALRCRSPGEIVMPPGPCCCRPSRSWRQRPGLAPPVPPSGVPGAPASARLPCASVGRLGGYCMRRSPPWPSSLGPLPGFPGAPLCAGFPGLAPGGLLSALRPPAGGLRRRGARPGRGGPPCPPLAFVVLCLGDFARAYGARMPRGLCVSARSRFRRGPGPLWARRPAGGRFAPRPPSGGLLAARGPPGGPLRGPGLLASGAGGVAAQAPRGALRPPRSGFRRCGAGRGLKARCFASVGLLCFRRFLPCPLPVPPPRWGRGKRGADFSARAGFDSPGEALPVPFRNLPRHGPRPRRAGALPPFFMSRNRPKMGAYAARRRSFHCTGG